MLNINLLRMKELISQLNPASDSYYNYNISVMENREYNTGFDELKELEDITGIILSNSPTQRAGYKIVNSDLPKVKHDIPLLSLGKIKDAKELVSWIGDREGILMEKMDGGTGKTKYIKLIKELSTRGGSDTNEGEDISHNINSIGNIPQAISIENETQVTGEMYMDFEDFNRINSKILDPKKKYTHPRNLATATASIMDSRICKERNIKFKAFNIIKGIEFKTKIEQLEWLKAQGFDTVNYWLVNKDNLEEKMEEIQNSIPNLPYPIDGLVLAFNDLEYGLSLGKTSHHFKHSISFKFEDLWHETKYDYTEWNPTRTGQIVPTGIFNTVLIDNCRISRASLSNVSIFQSLKLGEGDTIEASKRNMIIPKIENNITRSNTEQIPTKCPVCGGQVEVRQDNESKKLYCLNPTCDAKLSKTIEHYCIKSAMNIKGLSSATIEAFMKNNIIKDIGDLYKLEDKKNEILKLPRFAIPRYNKLISAIEISKKTTLVRFLNSLGIPNIGLGTSKDIAEYFDNKWSNISDAIENGFDFGKIEDLGKITNDSLYSWYLNVDNKKLVLDLLEYIEFNEEKKVKVEDTDNLLYNKTVYPTGVFNLKKDELKSKLEEVGAIIANSYSKKLDYLLCGHDTSKTTKPQKAIEDKVPLMLEEEMIKYLK
ncbi:NAD-dependent DNA ligase LigA [Clostridium tagluense]|uniref:DNA ligase (NAD(+)) n=1 Tax=Clostridium tagluense TaxID=360422 RepID=A0A401UQB6_9CLOT|nr:NAD-dependent DNA ligase LigA [Clostridium tagluense]GCD11753.1 DNA ligase 2 [Clostridium tagluense]